MCRLLLWTRESISILFFVVNFPSLTTLHSNSSDSASLEAEIGIADVALLVYSSDYEDSFRRVRSFWLPFLNQRRPDLRVVLAGNKVDLRTADRLIPPDHPADPLLPATLALCAGFGALTVCAESGQPAHRQGPARDWRRHHGLCPAEHACAPEPAVVQAPFQLTAARFTRRAPVPWRASRERISPLPSGAPHNHIRKFQSIRSKVPV